MYQSLLILPQSPQSQLDSLRYCSTLAKVGFTNLASITRTKTATLAVTQSLLRYNRSTETLSDSSAPTRQDSQ